VSPETGYTIAAAHVGPINDLKRSVDQQDGIALGGWTE
jgi:hypothetical protein